MKTAPNNKLILITILPLLLFSCRPQSSSSPGSLASQNETPELAEQVSRLATQTAIATNTAYPAVQAPESPPPERSSTALLESPTPMPLLEEAGPFQQVSSQEAMIAGRVIGLQTDPDGSLWLLSQNGFSHYQDGNWIGYLTAPLGELIGADKTGRFWVAGHEGSTITSWDQVSWITYTLDSGWLPLAGSFGMPVKSGVVSDGYGNIWLTTEQDVRMFDGQRWQVFKDEDMGMPSPQMEDHFTSYQVASITSSGQVWVGRCDWVSEGPAGGGGVRKFDGQSWQTAGTPFESGCITAIQEGPDSDIWVGQEATLWRYNPAINKWVDFYPPAPPEERGTRYGFFVNITIDPTGNPWPELEICSEASCLNGEVLYQFKDGEWIQVGEVSEGLSRDILFDTKGAPWLITGGKIYRVMDDTLNYITELNVLTTTTDHTGQIWLVAQGIGPPSLWKLEATE